MKMEKTERGFTISSFKDRYGKSCSIQDSSLATEACIWLGVDEVDEKPARMHLTRDMAKELLAPLRYFVK